jgi:hypothetical protein
VGVVTTPTTDKMVKNLIALTSFEGTAGGGGNGGVRRGNYLRECEPAAATQLEHLHHSRHGVYNVQGSVSHVHGVQRHPSGADGAYRSHPSKPITGPPGAQGTGEKKVRFIDFAPALHVTCAPCCGVRAIQH